MATATSSRVPAPLPLPAMDWGVSAGAGGHSSLGWPLQDTARPPGGHPPHPALAGLSRGCHQLVPGAMGTLVSPIAAGTCSGPLCKQCLAKTPLGRDPRGMWQPALPSPACPRPSKVQNDTGSSWGGQELSLQPRWWVGAQPWLALRLGTTLPLRWRPQCTCASRLAGTARHAGLSPGTTRAAGTDSRSGRPWPPPFLFGKLCSF